MFRSPAVVAALLFAEPRMLPSWARAVAVPAAKVDPWTKKNSLHESMLY